MPRKKAKKPKKIKKIKEINRFIMKRPYFLWWVPKSALEKGSEESIVEATLNQGDMDDVNEMIDILGMKKVKKIFYQQARHKRNNYHREVINYFRLFFRKYAT